MKAVWIICVMVLITACGGSSSSSPEKSEGMSAPKVIVEKEKVEKEQPLPPEVKIRLKRDGKESYSWELSGTDADQILKVNEKMRKQLGGEKSR
ncbi:MAG: hypothetical protein A2162_11720 [Deltaproteobacteria bacterium RBG_13_52_11b]|nr:MAG: hypothetical protein A2162_11720 [Deltaproteobacteria bacterium RBG_13_52_11b]